MLKRLNRFLLLGFMSFILVVSGVSTAAAGKSDDSDSIDEKFGMPVVVFGETLTDAQKKEVRKLLNVNDATQVDEVIVTAQDLARLIGGNPNSRMFSSAKITLKEKGYGLVVTRVTPDLITEVTEEMYANAMLTAGIENAQVEVASPVKVSGHSALVGIYKAYESRGEVLDKDRMEVANEELDLATDLAGKDGLDSEKVGELLTEIKKAIAEHNPVTREEVEQLVSDQLKKMKIELSDKDRQLLIDLFDKMRSLDIDFGNVKKQLEDLTKDIRDKMKDAIGDEGFWEKVLDFFRKIFEAIANLFK